MDFKTILRAAGLDAATLAGGTLAILMAAR